MSETAVTIVVGAIPVLAGLIAWLYLWRRNAVIFKRRIIHFCGAELLEKGYLPEDHVGFPLLDATYFTFTNLGFKHLDKVEFEIVGLTRGAVWHPCHTNSLPTSSFDLDDSGRTLKCTVQEVPALETFSIAILDTGDSDGIKPKGSGKHYFIRSRRKYIPMLLLKMLVLLVFVATLIYLAL